MSTPVSILKINSVPFEDTGYTKVCPRCAARHGNSNLKIGKPRELEMTLCRRCYCEPPQKVDRRFVQKKHPAIV